MAKKATRLGGSRRTPGAVEQQRLHKIAETRRAVKQERALVTLGRQLRVAFIRTRDARLALAQVLASECGYDLVPRQAVVNE